ncbi:MAG: class I SAM-dependent methyltransferase [Actinomycetota bacterium]|nr:class I SAM-dependent methyltransferase [Actinomycetota bacterium]
MNTERERIEAVRKAYSELAQKRENWPNKYDISTQLGKMLSDYMLLAKIDMLDKKVLNIGCSEPIDEVFWASIVGEWHALDINRDAIEMAREMTSEALPPQLYSRLKFITADVTDLDMDDESYDVVTSFSTIDHIPGHENRAKAIIEMSRVLKRGGFLAITVPNKLDFIYSYRSNKSQKEGKAVFGYEYQFSPRELREMILDSGLEILDCASTAFNPYSYLDKLLHKLKIDKVKIMMGTRFGYLARKRAAG